MIRVLSNRSLILCLPAPLQVCVRNVQAVLIDLDIVPMSRGAAVILTERETFRIGLAGKRIIRVEF